MRPTKAIISLEALTHNLQAARRHAPAARIVAVVKANAYGHGALAVARALEPMADALAVACVEEAVQLRDAGIRSPILVLEGADASDSLDEASARNFWLMVHREGQLRRMLEARLPAPLSAWIKFDSGMHRLGFDRPSMVKALDAVAAAPHRLQPPVLCTHLACADIPDSPVTRRQLDEFRSLADGYRMPLSIANSAGIMFHPDSHADWNRPGYMLYGNCPSGRPDPAAAGLRPAMRLESAIIALRSLRPGESVGYGQRWTASRPSLIGTVPIGYADGYPRHAPDGTPVLVRGVRAPLAGTVSMDMITVDLTELGRVEVGDPVELWGEELSVNEVAAKAGTIGYELLAGMTRRVPLEHVG